MTGKELIEGIRTVVKEELTLIKKTLKEHSKRLEGITDQLTDVSEDVAGIKGKLESQTKRITVIEGSIGLTHSTD